MEALVKKKRRRKESPQEENVRTLKRTLFLLTLNEVEKWDKLLNYLNHFQSLNYIIASKEKAPKTGHEHIHCMIQFSCSISLDLRKVCGAHVDICKGTPQQVKKYVEKDGDIIYENGNIRISGNSVSIKQAKEMPKEERELLNCSYYNIVNKINDEEDSKIRCRDLFKDLKVIYIWGPSGIGKSRRARDIIEEKIGLDAVFDCVKHERGFWIGIKDSNVALYDDFRDYHMTPSEFINFIDYNTHILNVKYGYKKNKYTLIIITSIQDPEMLYEKNVLKDDEEKRQWLRRITEIVHMEEA